MMEKKFLSDVVKKVRPSVGYWRKRGSTVEGVAREGEGATKLGFGWELETR